MRQRTSMRFLVGLFAFFAVTGFTALAAASGPIFTFGGQTFYQDAWPDQYELCVTAGSPFQNGAPVTSSYCDGSASQQFTYDPYTGQVSQTQGSTTLCMMLDISTSYVVMWTCGDYTEEGWFTRDGNLRNAYNLEPLDVLYGNTGTNAPLDVTIYNGTQAQWIWDAARDWPFYLQAYESNYCLAENGTSSYWLQECCWVGGSNCSSAQLNAQLYQLTDWQAIQNWSSSRYLSMNTSGQLVQSTWPFGWIIGEQWPTNNIQNQGAFAFFQALIGYQGQSMCLDVYGDNDTAGTPVDVSDYWGSCANNSWNNGQGNLAQFWTFHAY